MADGEAMRERIDGDIGLCEAKMKGFLGMPASADFVCRDLLSDGRRLALFFLEGMADGRLIDRYAVMPLQGAGGWNSLLDLSQRAVGLCQCEEAEYYAQAVEAVLEGKCAVFAQGGGGALILDTRGPAGRAVDRPQGESAVMGPQEGFGENLRVNVTLIRRIVKSEKLVGEALTVGAALPTRVEIMYIQGVARQEVVDAVRERVQSLPAAQCPGAGRLEQWMEGHPLSLFPQMLQTERPDRAASMLTGGQVALLVDGSPYALICPVTLFHLLHAADDGYLRWQNGTFLRLVRMLGAALSLILPAAYLAVTTHHSHVLPADLLMSIAETRSRVPFSVLTEIWIMEAAFFLINEAGTRVPSRIGPAVGIVGALILGQAAVSASLISPLIIIVAALTGLGAYCVPYYPLNLTLCALRLGLTALAGAMGLYGLALGLVLLWARLCALDSFGVGYMEPLFPHRPHNDDLWARGPIWRQGRRFLARHDAWTGEKP